VEADVQFPWNLIVNQMEIWPKEEQRPMIDGAEWAKEQGPIRQNKTGGLMCLMDVLPDILVPLVPPVKPSSQKKDL
jgi:hypothetical protein